LGPGITKRPCGKDKSGGKKKRGESRKKGGTDPYLLQRGGIAKKRKHLHCSKKVRSTREDGPVAMK